VICEKLHTIHEVYRVPCLSTSKLSPVLDHTACWQRCKQLAQIRRATTGNRTGDFYPRDAMLARVLAIALCLSVCVCLSQVGVLSKGMNGLMWFLAWRLFSTSPALSFKEIRVFTKIRVLPSGNFS